MIIHTLEFHGNGIVDWGSEGGTLTINLRSEDGRAFQFKVSGTMTEVTERVKNEIDSSFRERD